MKIKKSTKAKAKVALSVLAAAAVAVPTAGFAISKLAESQSSYARVGGNDTLIKIEDPGFNACIENIYSEKYEDHEKGPYWLQEHLDRFDRIECKGQEIGELADIDLSPFRNLNTLGLYDSMIDSLSIQETTSLKTVYLANNKQLQTLKVVDTPALETLRVDYNYELLKSPLTSIQLSNNNQLNQESIQSILNLVAHSQDLLNLSIQNNPDVLGEKLGLPEGVAINLKTLDLSNNDLRAVDIRGHMNLESLKLANNYKLDYLDVAHNQLSNLDISGSNNIKELYVYDNQLVNLDVSNLTNLDILAAYSNQLENVVFGTRQEPASMILLSDNKLTSIDMAKIAPVELVTLDRNNITSIVLDDSDTSLHGLTADDIMIRSNRLMSDQIAGTRDIDLKGFPLVGQIPLKNRRGGETPENYLGNSIPKTENYTFNESNSQLAISNLEGTKGYVQTQALIDDDTLAELKEQYKDGPDKVKYIISILPYFTYKLQLYEGADPIPVPHTDGGNAGAPNTGFGSATTIVTAASIAVPTLIASLLVTRAIRNRKRGHLKFD